MSFTPLCPVIDQENSIKTKLKLKLTASWSLPFLARQAVGTFFSLIFHWLLSSVVLIGCCDFFLYDSL